MFLKLTAMNSDNFFTEMNDLFGKKTTISLTYEEIDIYMKYCTPHPLSKQVKFGVFGN